MMPLPIDFGSGVMSLSSYAGDGTAELDNRSCSMCGQKPSNSMNSIFTASPWWALTVVVYENEFSWGWS
jgi:hypothetical protein